MSKGFGIKLNEIEKAILECFRTTDLLVWPDLPLELGEGEGYKHTAITSLKRKGLIKGDRPWRLTHKGQVYLAQL